MKPKYFFRSISLLSLLCSLSSHAHKLIFNQPFHLTGSNLVFKTQKRRLDLDRKEGHWKHGSQSEFIAHCAVDISLQGRDLALKNRKIGEHYFGRADFNCDGRGLGSQDFKAQYSRVLVTGIRNCVESETMIDSDYCKLRVYAFHKESDLSKENGDLIYQSDKRRDFVSLHSSHTKANIEREGAIPEGLDLNQIDGALVFEMSLGIQGTSFYLSPGEDNSPLVSGVNYYLQASPDYQQRESSQEQLVVGSLEEMERTMIAIQASPNAKEELRAKSAQLFTLMSKALKETLALMSPVTYHRNERRIRDGEANLLQMFARIDPAVTSRENWLSEYRAALGDYESVSRYLQSGSRPVLINTAAKGRSEETKGTDPGNSNSAPKSESIVGKVFMKSDVLVNRGTDFIWEDDGACGLALKDCNKFILSLGEKAPYHTCAHKRFWRTSALRYCEIEVKAVQP